MKRHFLPLLLILVVAVSARALLLASDAVTFHSDEAIVGLMARHILAGQRPVFFYGQAYMGSLDAWLTAAAFQIFGETVLALRLTQSALYLLLVVSGYAVAWRFSGKLPIAVMTGLLLALPVPLLALYTTASLGGYGEMLLCGQLALLLGERILRAERPSPRSGGLLGLVVGVGWWSNGLIIAYALPIALALAQRFLWRERQNLRAHLALMAIGLWGFFVGSAAWWDYNLRHDWAALAFYVPGLAGAEDDHVQYMPGWRAEPVANEALPRTEIGGRLLGLLLFGFPALIGLRFPWSSDYFLPALGLPLAALFCVALYSVARDRDERLLNRHGRFLTLAMIGGLCLIFVLSQFGNDPTGRYLLPLALPCALVTAAGIERLRALRPNTALLAVVVALLPLAYQTAGQIGAVQSAQGLTTQFDALTDLPNTYDSQLIAFLQENDLTRGYTQYWVAYRLIFLSDETLLYDPALPYKPTLVHRLGDNRYPAYAAAVAASARFAYITANQPGIDTLLRETCAARGIQFQSARIGPYTVYYDFEPAAPRPPIYADGQN
ncbi:MAG: glycosyltransferase family 39 protein [Chloroflexi bacterium]|nr:glycosyltransferase family 39 protein [Chloroflexota bacterium]